MKERVTRRIRMVPVDSITVLSPRAREKQKFGTIVESIGKVGLKRPITVTELGTRDGKPAFGLVCGEGRLKACIEFGQTEVAAVLVEASEQDCLVMSIVENCARRQHRAADLLAEVGNLRKRGYQDVQIAEKIGCTSEWVSMIGHLIENGEERLLAAVESGVLPITVAMEIARAEDTGVQTLLTQAYNEGTLSGGRLAKVRRLLDARQRRGKRGDDNPFGKRNAPRTPMSTQALVRVFQREADRKKVLVKKAEVTQSRLMFIVEALHSLRADEDFVTLLRAEHFPTMPAALERRLPARAN